VQQDAKHPLCASFTSLIQMLLPILPNASTLEASLMLLNAVTMVATFVLEQKMELVYRLQLLATPIPLLLVLALTT
jgi:hypothetical protein